MLGCIQPMSSPMMKRMLGFCCGCCAAAGVFAAITAPDSASRPRQKFLAILMDLFSSIWLPEMGRQPAPDVDRFQHFGETIEPRHCRYRTDGGISPRPGRSSSLVRPCDIVLRGKVRADGREAVDIRRAFESKIRTP